MTKPQPSRRQELIDRVNKPEDLDPNAIEVAADARAPGRKIEDEIQRQIAWHVAKKKLGSKS